jgi:hypothetical protein
LRGLTHNDIAGLCVPQRRCEGGSDVSIALVDQHAMSLHHAFDDREEDRKKIEGEPIGMIGTPKVPRSRMTLPHKWSRLGQRLITLGQ